MLHVLVLHGPNLNMVGSREPSLYGKTSLKAINAAISKWAKEQGVRAALPIDLRLQGDHLVIFTNPKDNEMVALKAEINGQGGPDASSPPPQAVAQPGLDMSAADKETRAGRLQELLGRVQARRAS